MSYQRTPTPADLAMRESCIDADMPVPPFNYEHWDHIEPEGHPMHMIGIAREDNGTITIGNVPAQFEEGIMLLFCAWGDFVARQTPNGIHPIDNAPKQVDHPGVENVHIVPVEGIDLEFRGIRLWESCGRHFSGKEAGPRYHNLRLWRRTDQPDLDHPVYVLHVEYMTEWDGEDPYDYIIEDAELPSLRSRIVQTNRQTMPYVDGFPPRPEYAERQENLLNHLRRMLRRQLTDMLKEAH